MVAIYQRGKNWYIDDYFGRRRIGELMNLRWDCVDFDRGNITVLNSKNNESRNIPMNTSLTQELENLKLHTKGDYVFARTDGGKPRSIRTTCENTLKGAGISVFRFHDLRHTFASNLVVAGADIVTVKELLGHKTIAMAMRYTHLNQEHKKRAVEDLHRHYMITGVKH